MNKHDPWEPLKQFTAARIAMGRAGSSIPVSNLLQFNVAHAHARDAVYSVLDREVLVEGLEQSGLPLLQVHSQARNRQEYLQRPDLGRLLDERSLEILNQHAGTPCDVSLVVADGLSARAVNAHAVAVLEVLTAMLQAAGHTLAPVCLATQARVALADPLAHALHARLSIILIGERPGLSAADSLGAYITYAPRPGLTDESRNCISNIRPQGLPYQPAAHRIFYLVQEALRRGLSGVGLKDNSLNQDSLEP
ncbi:MAG: ethanolamine ammonia-lyase subunit EutC [Williamsia sp.]|nr:ethanolamine ammonia-lyase subunit EutC [Williamsia sp.]